MSDRITLLADPVQITDGTNNAHVTIEHGLAAYADSEDSAAWHKARTVLNISPPLKIWMKKAEGDFAIIVATRFPA